MELIDFDFNALETPYVMTDLVVTNANARPSPEGRLADSDGDGMPDQMEHDLGTQAEAVDSDEDGYTDHFEHLYRDRGFDPLDPDAPALSCRVVTDTDGDGLRDCEEAFLGTAPRLADSDGDHLLDGQEVFWGTDPTVADIDRDPDYDGVTTRDEIMAGTHPTQADAEPTLHDALRFTVADLGEQIILDPETGDESERRCYGFDIENIRLAVTPQARDRGRNRIYLQAYSDAFGLTAARSRVRQACVEVRHPGEGVKRPASGVVDITPEGLQKLRYALLDGLDAMSHCAGGAVANRGELAEMVYECLPVRLEVDGVLFTRDEVVALIHRYYGRDLTPTIPRIASDFFQPIELFEPDEHCFRAWETPRIVELMAVLGDVCGSCGAVE